MLEDRYKAVAFRTRAEIARRYPDRDLVRGGYQDAGATDSTSRPKATT